jgi:ribosomal protein S18 acetylase RimI-like enzyme
MDNGGQHSGGVESAYSGRANAEITHVAIRPLVRSDAYDLHRYCFPNETLDAVVDYVDRALRFVDRGNAAHLVAESGGRAVANAQLICWRNRAEIGSLVVAEPLRGRGIGSALIKALSVAAADLGAEVIEIGAEKNNQPVLGLYQRLGFTPYKDVHLPGNGSNKEHVVYLEKPVPPRN